MYSSSFSLIMKALISEIEEGILSTWVVTSVLMRPRLKSPGIPKSRNLVCALSFSCVLTLTRYISYSSSHLAGGGGGGGVAMCLIGVISSTGELVMVADEDVIDTSSRELVSC